MVQLMKHQQLYWDKKDDDTQGNTKPRGRPPVPLLTTKQKNTTTQKTAVTKKAAAKKKAAVKKKKPLTKKQQEKEDKKLPPPKLRTEESATIIIHGNYSPAVPYAYEVEQYNKTKPKFEPILLTDDFFPSLNYHTV